MAAIISKLNASTDWLKIAIDCTKYGDALDLTIHFINNQPTTQEFAFSNQTRKAELVGLHVLTQVGERVMPQHNLVIKPNHAEAAKHLLKQGESFSYTLKGYLDGQKLVFPGAIFNLESGQSHTFYFKYGGRQSNSITLAF